MEDDKDGKLDVEARPYWSSCRWFRSDRKAWKAEVEVKRPENAESPISAGRLLRFRG